MLKRKNRIIYGILICILLCTVSTPASAEPQTADQTQDEPVSGIEIYMPAVDAAKTQGRAGIENIFPTNEQSSGKDGKVNANQQTPNNPIGGNDELPILYEQKAEKIAEKTTTETVIAANPWFTPIWIISAVVIVLILLVSCLMKKSKKERKGIQ